jgi:hypothetical protein
MHIYSWETWKNLCIVLYRRTFYRAEFMKSEFINIFWWKSVSNFNTHCKMVCGMHGQESLRLCVSFTSLMIDMF